MVLERYRKNKPKGGNTMTVNQIRKQLEETENTFFCKKATAYTIVERLKEFFDEYAFEYLVTIVEIHMKYDEESGYFVLKAKSDQHGWKSILAVQLEIKEVIKLEAFLRMAFGTNNVDATKKNNEWVIIVQV